ncbi:DUF1707 SHOCT-like domain-containing protein, partial [Nonomuraea sp. H19]|uniref:DUF1707 SHOCT-like domain-containing protein n=1 Tax=Nonomuraea sp. H19 TaxID=3452206 RepID=UPI003F8A73D3
MRKRVSDEDRERTARQSQHAFIEGRFTHLELGDRLALTLTANTSGDLLGLIADLPVEPQVNDPQPVHHVGSSVQNGSPGADLTPNRHSSRPAPAGMSLQRPFESGIITALRYAVDAAVEPWRRTLRHPAPRRLA